MFVTDEFASSLYSEIINNWSVEALKENPAYFYNINEVNQILNGKKSIVIGRKGSGKTSIAKYLCGIEKANMFTQKMSFKNFPFNILYSLDNKKDYTNPNQYISIWKLLIYTCVCKLMITNEGIDNEIRNKLRTLYGDESEESLDRLLEKWTSKEFGIEVLGIGFNIGGSKDKTETSWIEQISILESIILTYCDKSCYYIVFDELDEDYKTFQTEQEENDYFSMVTSLIKATEDIRNTFDNDDRQKCIYPVVFLRSDIYSRVKHSDKNKWREELIELAWDRIEIQKMLAHRLSVAMNYPNDLSFDKAWLKLFASAPVKMGNRQQRSLPIYDYIERSTEMRPRDFIQYIKEACILADRVNEYPIAPSTIKDADESFSDYLRGETVDELFAILPDVESVLGLLSTIRKQSFSFSEFENAYNQAIKNGDIPKGDVKKTLLLLFDAGVIGNRPSMKNHPIFKFSHNSPRFNFTETMIIHRGLYKALQIY